MGSYIPSTPEERQDMLHFLGMNSMEDLFAVVPEDVRIKYLDLPAGMSEMEVSRRMEEIAARNTRFTSVFRGAGAYRHYIPASSKLSPPKRNSSRPIPPIRRKSARAFCSPSSSIRPRCAS